MIWTFISFALLSDLTLQYRVPALGSSLCAMNDGLGGFVGASGDGVPFTSLT